MKQVITIFCIGVIVIMSFFSVHSIAQTEVSPQTAVIGENPGTIAVVGDIYYFNFDPALKGNYTFVLDQPVDYDFSLKYVYYEADVLTSSKFSSDTVITESLNITPLIDNVTIEIESTITTGDFILYIHEGWDNGLPLLTAPATFAEGLDTHSWNFTSSGFEPNNANGSSIINAEKFDTHTIDFQYHDIIAGIDIQDYNLTRYLTLFDFTSSSTNVISLETVETLAYLFVVPTTIVIDSVTLTGEDVIKIFIEQLIGVGYFSTDNLNIDNGLYNYTITFGDSIYRYIYDIQTGLLVEYTVQVSEDLFQRFNLIMEEPTNTTDIITTETSDTTTTDTSDTINTSSTTSSTETSETTADLLLFSTLLGFFVVVLAMRRLQS